MGGIYTFKLGASFASVANATRRREHVSLLLMIAGRRRCGRYGGVHPEPPGGTPPLERLYFCPHRVRACCLHLYLYHRVRCQLLESWKSHRRPARCFVTCSGGIRVSEDVIPEGLWKEFISRNSLCRRVASQVRADPASCSLLASSHVLILQPAYHAKLMEVRMTVRCGPVASFRSLEPIPGVEL